MPWIEVTISEARLTGDVTSETVIRGVTDGLVSVLGETARKDIWVAVHPLPPERLACGEPTS
jgi:phenylpyruvate tautomerase PptA (4-oxalocrotonate tautomerase family)